MIHSRKHALSLAKQIRTCPPTSVLEAIAGSQEARTHLSLCPYCPSRIHEEAKSWDRLAAGAAGIVPSAQKRVEPIELREGALCPIVPALGGWREGFYYNPPIVLVLRAVSLHRDVSAWKVAQTYHDVLLAGPGDLIVPGGRSPLGDIFIESWNTYTLRSIDLASPLGDLGPEVSRAAISLEADPSHYPAWAPQPKPMDENDARIYFREMEVEVGYAFSSRAVAALMAEMEQPRSSPVYLSNAALQKELKKRVPGLRWPVKPGDLEEVLILARFPDEALPMAAKDEAIETTTVNLVVFEKGEVRELMPLRAEIMKRDRGVSISGQVLDLPGALKGSRLMCRFVPAGGRAISPRRVVWEAESGNFMAEFDTEAVMEGRLLAAVIVDGPPSP